MTATTAPDALLMRFQPTDTASRVSRATLTKLAKQLGYKRESEVLPAYEADDGPLTAKQMAVIRKAAGPASRGKVVSSLF